MTDSKLVLHQRTKLIVEQTLNRPSHAILITGPARSGKHHLAKYISTNLLNQSGVSPNQQQYQMVDIYPSDNDTISIDQIRDIYRQVRDMQMSLKIVRIYDGQSMGAEAQNALLKILEEPPANVIFVITTNNSDSLLKTIVSRSQIVPILPLTHDEMTQYLTVEFTSKESEDIKLAVLKSSGRLSSAISLLSDPTDDMTGIAKQILTSQLGDRLILSQKYLQDRDQCTKLLKSLLMITRTAMQSSANRSQSALTVTWTRRLSVTDTALGRLNQHANPKIQLLNVLYSL